MPHGHGCQALFENAIESLNFVEAVEGRAKASQSGSAPQDVVGNDIRTENGGMVRKGHLCGDREGMASGAGQRGVSSRPSIVTA